MAEEEPGDEHGHERRQRLDGRYARSRKQRHQTADPCHSKSGRGAKDKAPAEEVTQAVTL
ncbi:MAG: hypothetical protein ACJ8AW_33705 [Rhodopila sp.]